MSNMRDAKEPVYPFRIKKIRTKHGKEAFVKFTKRDVKLYLLWAIANWRRRKKLAAKDSTNELVARCYIDAYLSVLKSLGLEGVDVL